MEKSILCVFCVSVCWWDVGVCHICALFIYVSFLVDLCALKRRCRSVSLSLSSFVLYNLTTSPPTIILSFLSLQQDESFHILLWILPFSFSRHFKEPLIVTAQMCVSYTVKYANIKNVKLLDVQGIVTTSASSVTLKITLNIVPHCILCFSFTYSSCPVSSLKNDTHWSL